jgi:hypothetical protein
METPRSLQPRRDLRLAEHVRVQQGRHQRGGDERLGGELRLPLHRLQLHLRPSPVRMMICVAVPLPVPVPVPLRWMCDSQSSQSDCRREPISTSTISAEVDWLPQLT